MEELDLNDENRLYDAARDEAAELVWKHRNPNAPENNPAAAYAYPGLQKKEGQQRSRSLGRGDNEPQSLQSKMRKKRSSMGSSTAGSRSSSLQSHRTPSESSVTANAGFSTSPTKDTFLGKSEGPSSTLSKMPSGPSATRERRRSSGTRRKASASLFKNPNDQIYEEPEEESKAAAPEPAAAPAPKAAPEPTPAPAAPAEPPPLNKLPLSVRRNPFSRVQFAKNNILSRSNTDPTVVNKQRFDRYEIQNNPPTQSRVAGYTSNSSVSAKPKADESVKPDADKEPEVKMKDGKEIRSDELRAATGFRLKDRSPKLPTPTAVSDSPGRPIVSFRNDWKATKEIELKEEISLSEAKARPNSRDEDSTRPLSKSATAPVVPTINVPEEAPRKAEPVPVPSINVSSAPSRPSSRLSRSEVPTISVQEDPPTRPLPNVSASRKVHAPYSSPASIPTINVSQAPPARSKPSAMPPIPTISISETPSISVSPASQGSSNVKAPAAPAISVTPSIPSISVSETPSISVTPSVPSINVNGPAPSTRPLPDPKHSASRGMSKPFPRNNGTTTKSHWTPTSVRSGVLCQQCALPISGRIVSAAGCRFHPECFRCHHCAEHLECVAFYPEPTNKHAERVARIRARQRGEDIEFLPTHPTHDDMVRLEQDDGFDENMRFFCHLDFHELFSPRCKSCKTPIEGEVVVACGAEWHVGHFFCAQCGDPFDSTTPFVEKDGYAWCVGCHTNRYSAKCRQCRRPVTDTVVKALGAEWHVGCFCCVVSALFPASGWVIC